MAAHLHRHATHAAKPGVPMTLAPPEGPLPPDSREANDLLESLDDAMFIAIAGEAGIAATARELWMVAQTCLPSELLEESREQYLRFAVEITQPLDFGEPRDPAKALIALEIIELLTGP